MTIIIKAEEIGGGLSYDSVSDIGQIYSISGDHIEMPYNKKQKRK